MIARARYLGGRLSVRDLPGYTPLAQGPLIVAGREAGFFVVLRFGAVVSIGGSDGEFDEIVRLVRPNVDDPGVEGGDEMAEVRTDPEASEGPLPDGILILHSLDPGRLQVLAAILGKSAVLSHYEQRVAAVFDRVETLAAQLHKATIPASGREILAELGESLLIRTRTVGRVEVGEKPEITWDDPPLDRLYERLAVEFELADRDRALSRKLDLMADVASTYLELLHSRNSIRVEWYIVILIVIEIVLVIWQMVG